MKKTIIMVSVIVLSLLSASVKAQQTWNAKKNPTVDSITSPYEAKLLPPRPPMTTMDIFPVIGTYESSTNTDAPSVTIALDEQNKGLVWIAGLPQGKIKAMLRKSPSTYKIPAQKTEDGKDVPEGTLIFDKEANTLSICIGKPYNTEDPSAAFTMTTEDQTAAMNNEDLTKTKTKTASGKTIKTKIKQPAPKPWVYTGTKVEKATVSNQ
jgi:hypothetical protein